MSLSKQYHSEEKNKSPLDKVTFYVLEVLFFQFSFIFFICKGKDCRRTKCFEVLRSLCTSLLQKSKNYWNYVTFKVSELSFACFSNYHHWQTFPGITLLLWYTYHLNVKLWQGSCACFLNRTNSFLVDTIHKHAWLSGLEDGVNACFIERDISHTFDFAEHVGLKNVLKCLSCCSQSWSLWKLMVLA